MKGCFVSIIRPAAGPSGPAAAEQPPAVGVRGVGRGGDPFDDRSAAAPGRPIPDVQQAYGGGGGADGGGIAGDGRSAGGRAECR